MGPDLLDALTAEVKLLAAGKEPSDRLHVFLRVTTQKAPDDKGWSQGQTQPRSADKKLNSVGPCLADCDSREKFCVRGNV